MARSKEQKAHFLVEQPSDEKGHRLRTKQTRTYREAVAVANAMLSGKQARAVEVTIFQFVDDETLKPIKKLAAPITPPAPKGTVAEVTPEVEVEEADDSEEYEESDEDEDLDEEFDPEGEDFAEEVTPARKGATAKVNKRKTAAKKTTAKKTTTRKTATKK